MKIELNKDIYFSNCSGVFQGGGCKAIAYIGAYEVAYEHGIMFSELAGTSAGSIIAAAIALGASPDDIKDFVKQLDFNDILKVSNSQYPEFKIISLLNNKPQTWLYKFLFWCFRNKSEKFLINKLKGFSNPFFQQLEVNRILNEYGIYDSSLLQNKLCDWFSDLSGIYNPSFKDLPVKLHVLAGDVPRHRMKVYSQDTTPDVPIAEAVAASCSIPLLFTPPQKKYVDGGLLSNRPDILIENKSEYFRTLSFSLKSEETKIKNLGDFTFNIIDTIINGADEIQHLHNSTDNVEILCKGFKSTDFNKMTPDNVNKLIDFGRTAMNSFLIKLSANDNELGTPHVHLHSIEQVYSQVAHWSYNRIDDIVVVADNLDWVWHLFPSIVGWSKYMIKLKVFFSDIEFPESKEKIIKKYKDQGYSNEEAINKFEKLLLKQKAILRFLMALNVEVEDSLQNTPKGFYFRTGNKCKAIIFKNDGDNFIGKIYTDDIDSTYLNLVMPKPGLQKLSPIMLIANRDTEIIHALKKIKMYENAEFNWESMNVTDLKFLNKFIRGDKYKQIYNMFNLFPENLEVFSSSAVALNDKQESLVGPIVVEQHGRNYFVIEGNTRVLFAYKHNVPKVKVLVVRKVSADLPLDMQLNPDGFPIDKVRISEKGRAAEDRYNGFNYSLFRPIEQTLRPDAEYLNDNH